MAAALHLPIFTPPRVRGDCMKLPRPCPMIQCRHRIENGPNEGACALDYIDKNGSLILKEVGRIFGFTRERARQIETKALRKLAIAAKRRGLKLEDLLPAPAGATPLAAAIEPDNRSPSAIARVKGTGRGRKA